MSIAALDRKISAPRPRSPKKPRLNRVKSTWTTLIEKTMVWKLHKDQKLRFIKYVIIDAPC